MTDFRSIHAAIFDELERQGAMGIDVGRLTAAVLGNFHVPEIDQRELYRRCASGACDE